MPEYKTVFITNQFDLDNLKKDGWEIDYDLLEQPIGEQLQKSSMYRVVKTELYNNPIGIEIKVRPHIPIAVSETLKKIKESYNIKESILEDLCKELDQRIAFHNIQDISENEESKLIFQIEVFRVNDVICYTIK